MTLKPWIEALRLRTLPVSAAGVIAGIACALFAGVFAWPQALCCLIFALLAQIAANFANEYFDFKKGLDRPGREGFRRGVTEGDISPRAMLVATGVTLALAAIPGCTLIIWGGWWLLPLGFAIALFALAYSAGPFPLSHNGLGDLAVILFFGFVPVMLTYWLQTANYALLPMSAWLGAGIGLLAANVLIVNNVRDEADDRKVHKRTTAVIFGGNAMCTVYLVSLIAGLCFLCAPAFCFRHFWGAPLLMLPFGIKAWMRLRRLEGRRLNPVLGQSAAVLLGASALLLLESLISAYTGH